MFNYWFKKSMAFTISIILVVNFIPIIAGNKSISNRIIYVDDDNTEGPWLGTNEYPYQQIQEAIDNATENDIIIVYSGIYSPVTVDKKLLLRGIKRIGGGYSFN